MKLLIRNLARSTTEAEVRTLFETFGVVQSCILVIDSKTNTSKGFGFVEMPKQGSAKAAMKTLNGTAVDGNLVRVKKAGPNPSDTPGADKDPLHGMTLEMILTQLVKKYDWDGLGRLIDLKCFTSNPSMASSLKFLRNTAWARKKVESLYLNPRMDNEDSTTPTQQTESPWAQSRQRKPRHDD